MIENDLLILKKNGSCDKKFVFLAKTFPLIKGVIEKYLLNNYS